LVKIKKKKSYCYRTVKKELERELPNDEQKVADSSTKIATLTKTNGNKIPRTNTTGSTVRSEIRRPDETLPAGLPPATAVVSLPDPLPPPLDIVTLFIPFADI
jgi:hypothetical protein